MFPFIVHLILKYKDNLLRIGIITVVCFVFLLILFSILPSNLALTRWFVYFFPVTRIFEFIVGVVLGVIYLKLQKNFSKVSKTNATLLEIITLIMIIVTVVLSPQFNDNLRYGLVFAPFWSLIIFIFAFQKGIISTLLKNKILVYLGEISFSFYMVHNLILSYILFLWKPDINMTLLICLCFILTLITSSLLYHCYEEPMRKRVKQFFYTKLEYKKFRTKKIG